MPSATIGRLKGRAHNLLRRRGRRTRPLAGARLAVRLGGPVLLDPVASLADRILAKREQLTGRAAKRSYFRLVAKAFGSWLIGPKNGHPGRNSALFEEGLVEAGRVPGVGYEVPHSQVVGRQPCWPWWYQLRQVGAGAAVGEVHLAVADKAGSRIHGPATEVVERARFAGLDGNARFGVRGLSGVLLRSNCAFGCCAPSPLAGGPNPGQQDHCSYPSSLPACSYVDTMCSYASNEVALNWNAPLVYLTGALEGLQTPGGLLQRAKCGREMNERTSGSGERRRATAGYSRGLFYQPPRAYPELTHQKVATLFLPFGRAFDREEKSVRRTLQCLQMLQKHLLLFDA